MKFGDLTYQEIKQAAAQGWMVILPTGCVEQQGEHLPVDFDSWLAGEVCLAGSQKADEKFGVKSLVLTAVPFGPTPEHRGFGAGYIDLPADIHEAVIDAVLQSLVDQGFGRIMIWQGCGQHRLQDVVDGFRARESDGVDIAIAPSLYQRIWDELGIPGEAGGHADAFTTSIAMYRRPEAVRFDRIRDPQSSSPDWSDPALDLSAHSDSGSIGDPTLATADLGRRLWDAVIDDTAILIRDFQGRRPADGR